MRLYALDKVYFMSKKLVEIVNQFFNDGLKDEEYVMKIVEENLGGTCYKSSKKEDMVEHIDIWWNSPKKGKISIDVKGRRKSKRNEKQYNDEITWIELKNVQGKDGWVYGKSDYIAFITLDRIIFVKTIKLRIFSEEKIINKKIVYNNPSDYYVPYQRKKYGRNDLMIKVPITDIIELSDFMIILNKNG